MAYDKTIIFCEGSSDERMLNFLVRALGEDKNTVIQALQRPLAPQMLLRRLEYLGEDKTRETFYYRLEREAKNYRKAIIVFDLDFGSPTQSAPEFSRLGAMWLVAAVPTVDCWLLSDPEVFESLSLDIKDNSINKFSTFISQTTHHFINERTKRKTTTRVIADIYDPLRAAMVSSSLRSFIKVLKSDTPESEKFDFNLPSMVLSALVDEFYPANAPIYKSLDGNIFSGSDMAREIRTGSPIGKKYASDLLRVSRDLLARQANKHEVT